MTYRPLALPGFAPALPFRPSHRLSFLAVMLCAGLILVGVKFSPAGVERVEQPEVARLSNHVSILAEGKGAPYINLSDGRDVVTGYSGAAELTAALQNNEVRPLALTSADYDEDGVPDLVSGYSREGRGIVTILRGNVDSIYPNSPEAQKRKSEGTYTDSPFLSPALVFEVPEAADHVGAGDFDGDSHWDVVAARRGGTSLHLLKGDGRGSLKLTREIMLPGGVTAFTTGEVNRRDGLEDVAVGVSTPEGARVLVFEGPNGALTREPEQFSAPGEVRSLALGQLDEEYSYDLAVGAGSELMIIEGRDRKLSLDSERQAGVGPARVDRREMSFEIKSIAVGELGGGGGSDVALLSEDGSIHILKGDGNKEGEKKGKSVTSRTLELLLQGGSSSGSLVRVRTSSLPVDNLAVVDPQMNEVRLLSPRVEDQQAAKASVNGAESSLLMAELEMADRATALLPMRLNSDALSDLVVLRGGSSAPSVVRTQAARTFTVTNTNDNGPGSLRWAMFDADRNPGADLIAFNIPGDGVPSIKLLRPPLFLDDSVTIDGTTQPAGRVELDGTNAGTTGSNSGRGIYVFPNTGPCTLRGLVVNRFAQSGIYTINKGNIIEGNLIGTDVTGTIALGNGRGISVSQKNTLIGGTTPQARNVISGNTDIGVALPLSEGNRVQGNYIGTDITGKVALGNRLASVWVYADNSGTTIGGTAPGARNVIAGNEGSGVVLGIFGEDRVTSGILVQGNYIGVDADGTAVLSNGGNGVLIANGNSNTIGGTVGSARNIISGNAFPGVAVGGGGQDVRFNLVQGNFIGTDVTGMASLPNTTGVILGGIVNNEERSPIRSKDNTVGGAAPGSGNLVSGNIDDGIGLYNSASQRNFVQGNLIGTDVTGTLALPNQKSGVRVTRALENTVGGTTPEARNVISGNGEYGVAIGIPENGLTGGTGLRILGNYIGTDITGTQPLGNVKCGVFVDADSVINFVEGNRIAFNGEGGVCIPNNQNPGVRISILANLVYSNGGIGIDLGPAGVTPNDNRDTDSGANELQNFPILRQVALASAPSPVPGSVRPQAVIASVSGTFNSTPNQTFTLEFFFGGGCSGSGSQFFDFLPVRLGSLPVTTDSSGNAAFTFDFSLPTGVTSGFVNATATSSIGNTSEFSQCLAIAGVNVPDPKITAASVRGKKLFVTGENFRSGAVILVNGVAQKTAYNSATSLTGEKAGKKVKAGDKIKVRNSGGTESAEWTY